jgi:murein DD-endopeptidase MepM/ murein hydrolase activator NlpD
MSSNLRRPAWLSSKPQFLMSAAVAAVLLAGCSAESDRFTANPSNSDPVYTASVPKRMTAANAGLEDQVTTKPLAGASQQQPPAYDYTKSYQAPQYRQPAATVPQPEIAAAPPAAPGGTITVGPGMTLYSIARANNIPVSQLAAANGLKAPYAVHTGQTLRLPGAEAPKETASFAEPESTPIAPKPGEPAVEQITRIPAKPASGGLHTVASGETLFSLGRSYGVSPYAIADANGLPHDVQLKLGQQVKIPGGNAPAPATAEKPAVAEPKVAAIPEAPAAPAAEAPAAPASTEAQTAAAAPEAAAPAKDQSSIPATEGEVAEQAPIEGAAGMRWPVRGKIISGFGPKANGLKNEGINIAVPEGTSIRAAADGVVAYAGNELKGYGNLVLIRHDSGYVTAYAHAKELFVKRGDTVKRGDVIAKAGQTGSVSSPQLHFEVRKGAVALDPMKFLSSATASN